MKQQEKIEFILFLDPTSSSFYSYNHSRGFIVKEDVEPQISRIAQNQINQLNLCMDDYEFEKIYSFQKRPIPLNLIIERKFKFPVYYTDQYLPPVSLEKYEVDAESNKITKEKLIDFIQARIHLKEIKTQLQKAKKPQIPSQLSINIKLIASVNETIRTITRVILQEYGVVVTMKNQVNRLVFKVKGKSQYLYGNETLINFEIVRDCVKEGRGIELELSEENIYDKEQLLKFIFLRKPEDIKRGIYAAFPWAQFMERYQDEEPEFLMWHVPDDIFTSPQTFIEVEKLFSNNQVVRNNEKIKLKIEEKRRLQIKKIPRYLWKDKIFDFLEKRKIQLKSKLVEIQPTIVFSGQCCQIFNLDILAVNNLFSMFIGESRESKENKIEHKKFLRLITKDMLLEGIYPLQLPSYGTRNEKFMQLKNDKRIQILVFMCSVSVDFYIGSQHLSGFKTSHFLADNHISMGQIINFLPISKIPLETSIVFKVEVFSKEGEGVVIGVGALKLFDEYGLMVQGKQQVHLYATSKIQIQKIGCMDKEISIRDDIAKITVKLPKFKTNVIWTLADKTCLKLLGYHPPKSTNTNPLQEINLEKLNQLLRYDPIRIYRYTDKEKELLRRCKKYYKHQSEKLINYLFAIDWQDPNQIGQAYNTINEWAPLKPIEALFLLTPRLADEKVRLYAVKRMENFMDYEWVLFSIQITQALVSFETHLNPLIDLIIQKCTYEPYTIGNEYYWQFKNRVSELNTNLRFNLYLQNMLMVSSFRKKVLKQVMINNYLVEMNQKLIKDTQLLSEFKDQNNKFMSCLDKIEERFTQISPEGFVFPIRPQFSFKKLKKDECQMFDSKKKPFSLACSFNDESDDKQKSVSKEPPYKIMFKYGDDLKQDGVILQIFRIFNKMWRENGLEFKMNIYRSLATGDQIGFIEIVQAVNNSKIHKDFGTGLFEAFDDKSTTKFLQTYNQNPKEHAMAKENYLRSQAGYLVATYILGLGDRHSGNVMVQKNGKFFHIDFGHILGNFKKKLGIERERSPVLFISEFLYAMGGSDEKEFQKFQKLCSKAFNIIRKNAYTIVNLLIMLVGADIPQLKKIEDIQYVTKKLILELSDNQAAEILITSIKQTLTKQNSRNLDNWFHETNRVG